MYQLIRLGSSNTVTQYMCDTYETACKIACEVFIERAVNEMEDTIAVSAILNLIDAEKYDKAIEVWNYMITDETYIVREVEDFTDEDVEMPEFPLHVREEYQECSECSLPLGNYGCTHMKD